MKKLGMGNVVEPSLSRPLWMFQEVLYILMCLVRVVNLHCQEGRCPYPNTRRRGHADGMPDVLGCGVFVEHPLNPMKPPHPYQYPETDPGLLWTYADEEHCKKKTNTQTVLLGKLPASGGVHP